MNNQSRALQFDNLEGRQLLSVAPVPHDTLLADISLDLKNLATQQVTYNKQVAAITAVQNDLTLDGRELTLAQGTFAADQTALLANLLLPPTKAVLAARTTDLAAVAKDTTAIKVIQKDITADTTQLALDRVKAAQDLAIVNATEADVTADIKAL
jgi:hypothetical protein